MIEARLVRRWRRAAEDAALMDRAQLRALRARARDLSQSLTRIIQDADARLLEGKAIPSPLHTEWAMRPELWRAPVAPSGHAPARNGAELGREAKVFHDCGWGEVSVRQRRNPPGASAPFSVEAEVFHFDGTFLSIAIDLPPEGFEGLTRHHLVRIGAEIEAERPARVFGRLNLRHGPNVATVTERFDVPGTGHVDLDLAEADFDDERLSGAWVDIIVEAPAMNGIRIRDVTVSRRPRAQV